MGMTGGLVRASETDIRRLRADRSTLSRFIEGDVWAPPVRRVQPTAILEWLLRLTPISIEETDPRLEHLQRRMSCVNHALTSCRVSRDARPNLEDGPSPFVTRPAGR